MSHNSTKRRVHSTLDFMGHGTTTGMRAPVEPSDGATRQFVVEAVADATGQPLEQVIPNLTLIFENALK